jgi:hypothetical protein
MDKAVLWGDKKLRGVENSTGVETARVCSSGAAAQESVPRARPGGAVWKH